MADVNANIGVKIDTSAAIAELKALQRQLATFHSSVAKNSAAATQAQKNLQTNLLNAINSTGKFHAQMGLVRSSTESFTHALEKNKLSMREYFRYAGGASRTFGKLFRQEFDTIGKVAQDRVRKMQTQYIKMGRDASGAIKSMSITPATLDMKNYSNQVAVAAQKQALLNQLLRQGSTNLLNFGKNTQWAGRQLMVGFTIPLAYFGTAAAKTFMDLEKQAIRFKRVYGDMFTTSDETNKALKDIELLAESFTKYGVAVTQTMEMASNAAAMGKTGADLLAQVSEATRLAILGNVEQAQALDTTISVTNAFGVAAEDLANKINFLNAVENQTVVSIEDLTEAIPKAGPVVKQLGGSVEDLAFFLTAMKEGGINASEGANALKSGLASLINPSDKASKMLADLGINIKGIVEANKGDIKGTVIQFAQALDTLDPLNRARAIEQLFGKFQFSRLSTLFQNVTKDGTQAARVLELTGASIEELAIISERELGVLEDAVGTDFRESIEKLKLAIVPIGKEFLKAITPVAKTVGNILEKFNNLGDGTKKFIVVATTLVGIIGPVLLMTFGLLANGVANIIKLFVIMRTGFLKAGSNTNLLAQQTQYLNSEQLEAATVAASLNQTHTRLTQSFNLETTAVRLLRQAYIDATIAATNFARANPGMMMPGFKPGIKGGGTGKKFASGTTRVVGGEAGKDSVPALLMPGEAVVPTDIAQNDKFKPLVEALVTGKIAQYGSGTTGVTTAPPPSGQTGFVYNNEVFPTSTNNAKKIAEQLNRKLATDPNFKIDTVLNRARDLIDPTRPESKRQSQQPKPITVTALRDYIKPQARSGNEANPAIGAQRRNLPYINPITGEVITNIDKNQKTRIMSDLNRSLIEAGLSQKEARSFIGLNESHLNKASRSDLKWFEGHVVKDIKGLNNYLNRIDPNRGKKGTSSFDKIIKEIEKNSNKYNFDKQYIKQIKKDIEFFKTGVHPFFPKDLQKLQRVVDFDIAVSTNKELLKNAKVSKNFANGVYQAKGVKVVQDLRRQSKNRFYENAQILKLGGDKLKPTAIAITPGELVEYNKKTIKQTTPSTGKPLGNTKVIGGGPTDTRLISGKGVTRIIPNKYGFKGSGSVAIGAAGGLNNVSTPGSGFRSGNIAPIMRVQETQLQQLITAINNNTAATQNNSAAVSGSVAGGVVPGAGPTAKEQRKARRAGRAQRIGGVTGPMSGALGMASMAAFVSGNEKLGMGLMGASAVTSILPMLTNPVTAVVAALTAAVAGIYFWNKSLEQSAKKQAEFVKATSGTTQKMTEIAKITNTSSASQVMAKRRERGVFGAYNDAQRAGQMFGDAFLQSDVGKSMVTGFTENMKKFGSKQAASDFALQLSTYVSDGVLTTDQAEGIAEQIGIQLGNQKYSIEIKGNLRSIVGPNGEDLTKDPMRVRTNIINEATSRTNVVLKRLQESKLAGNSGRAEAAQLAAIAANNLEIIKAQADATEFLYQKQIDVLQKDLEKTTNLEKQLEIKQKIAELESKQTTDVGTFNLKFSDQLNKELKTFSNISLLGKTQDAYFDSLKSTVKDTYKGTAFEKQAETALKNLAETSGFFKGKQGFKTKKQAQEFEVQMSLLMKNKILNPEQTNALLKLFEGKLPELQSTLDLGLKTHGPEKTVAMLDFFMGLDIDQTKAKEISVQIVKSDPATFDKIGEALASLQVLDGKEVNMAAYIETVGYKGLVDLSNKLDVVEKLPDTLSKEIILDLYENGKFIGTGVEKSQLELLMSKWKDFDALPDKLQKEAISKFITINETRYADKASYNLAVAQDIESRTAGMSSISKGIETNRLLLLAKQSYNEQLKQQQAFGVTPDKMTFRLGDEYAASSTFEYINEQLQKDTKKVGNVKGGGTGTQDDFIKDLLQRLKLVKDATINVNGGFEELKKVLANGTDSLDKFVGLNQLLRQQGISEEFIKDVGGLDAAIQKEYITITEEGITVTKKGEIAVLAYAKAISGEYNDATDQSILGLKAQADKFKELVLSGIDAKTALELVTDSEVALALRTGENTVAIDAQIEALRRRKQAEEDYLAMTDPEAAFEKQMNKANEYYDFLEREAKAAAKPEIDRIEGLISANEELIDIKQRQIEMEFDRPISKLNQDLNLIDKAAEAINKKYDDQEKALNAILEVNKDIADQEKTRLDVADALTSGDVASAARAIQEARSASARSAIEKQSQAIQAARQSEISGLTQGGLTRVQIEEKIYNLEQNKLSIVAQITELQDKNYNLQVDELDPLQKALDARIKNIDTARDAWNNQMLAIQKAAFEADKTNNVFKIGEGVVASIKKIWDDIKSKTIELKVVTTGDGLGTSTLTGATGGSKVPRGAIQFEMYGGKILPMNMGGIVPKYFDSGGEIGSDTVPAMLTPGEFVMNKRATQQFGPLLSMLNESKYPSMIGPSYSGQSASPSTTSFNNNSRNVYNYNVGINVGGTNVSANNIAQAVMDEIKYLDSQRIKGQRVS